MITPLTRRAFVQTASCGAGAVIGCCTLRSLPAPGEARFVDLADTWRQTTQRYLHVVRSRVGGAAFLAARNAAARASIRLLDAASELPRDVLVKYYVLYESMHFTSFDLDFSESRFDAWCNDAAREAKAFGLTVSPFWWTMRSDPNPRINGTKEKSTTDWNEVRPWLIRR